jgi:PmbA protein
MNKREGELLRLAEKLVGKGLKKGADEIQVTVSEGSEFSVDIREGGIEKLLEAGSGAVSIKVIFDHRTAVASSSDLSDKTLSELIENAVQRAKLASSDPCAGLPEYAKTEFDPGDLNVFDPKILEMSPERKIEAARKTEAIALSDKRIAKSLGASFGTYCGTVFLANSKGFSGWYRKTSCSCGVSLQAGAGDNLIDEGWADASPLLDNLDAPEAIAQKAVHRVTRLIGARKVETQNVPMVIEAPTASGFIGFLAQCVSGSSIYLKQSFLADKLGQSIGNQLVTVTDDGRIPARPGTRPFDAEGVPTRRTPVIENGILKNFLLDTYAARKLGMSSTGNASGTNNFIMAQGTASAEEIIRSVKKGLFLTGTIGFGRVATTGDISQGAFGIWIENGELSFPVAEITFSGNLAGILKGIEMIGNDADPKRSVTAPTFKVAEMTVGGK